MRKRHIIITALLLAVCTLLSACSQATQTAQTAADTPAPPASTEGAVSETEKITAPATTEAPATTSEPETEAPPPEEDKSLNYDDMKAMWLSQFDLNSVYTGTRGQRVIFIPNPD